MLKLLHRSRGQFSLRTLIVPLLATVLMGLCWATPAYATGVFDLPSLSAGEPTWVIDQADILSRINRGKLSDRLSELAKTTGNEVRLVTIHRLDYGETPQSLTDKLFEKWFPAPEEQANQTVLLIDDLTNGIAIHTGDATKGLMPDAIAQSVVNETMTAPLRDGNRYNQSFLDAVDRMVAVLSGQEDPGPPAVDESLDIEGTFTTAEETDDYNATIIVAILLLVATVIPMATYYLYVR